jgi:hypothetical protein
MVSRLPWCEELPRLWMATMRPTPVMIPVNMTLFSQGFGGYWRLTPITPGLKLIAPSHVSPYPQVITHHVSRYKLQFASFAQALQWPK